MTQNNPKSLFSGKSSTRGKGLGGGAGGITYQGPDILKAHSQKDSVASTGSATDSLFTNINPPKLLHKHISYVTVIPYTRTI